MLIEVVLLGFYIYFYNQDLESWFANHSGLVVLMSTVVPSGIIWLLNFYVLAPFLSKLFFGLLMVLGYYRYLNGVYEKRISECITWLVGLDKHWGIFATADECQNANTCEGLIALKESKCHKRKLEIYKDSFTNLLKNITDDGLPSKSFGHATVACTSLLLYLISLEQSEPTNGIQIDNSRFQKLAARLWQVRGDAGWGVFMDKTEPQYCSIANTFKAMRAINKYEVANGSEYKKYAVSMYEYAKESKFGFKRGDNPRLATTAMGIIFYYELDDEIRKKIDAGFNIQEAIDFVFDCAITKGQQFETEIFFGLDKKIPGAKKAPWGHVSLGFAIEALHVAYIHGKLSTPKMNKLIKYTQRVFNSNFIYPNKDQCYFIPHEIEFDPRGTYTYPTMYIVWGLSSFKRIIK